MIDSFTPVDPALIDVPPPVDSGYPDEVSSEDTPDALRSACGAASREFPQSLWIEPKDREAKARENDENKTWPINFIDRYTNQDPSHECTCHGFRTVFEGARNRSRAIIFPSGPKVDYRYPESSRGSAWISPLSLYCRANRRQWGGAGVIQVLNIACGDGVLPDKIQPGEHTFAHTLHGTSGKGNSNQSHGPWIVEEQFPDGWKETAKHFRPLEVVVSTDWEVALCLILHGVNISYGRKGHCVPPSGWNVSSNAILYPDSYNRTLYDSMSTFKAACRSGFYGIISTTTPDHWSEPGKN